MKKYPFIFTWVAILALLTLSYPSNAQERNTTRVFSRTASQLISPRVTISSTPNADGITFGSLGTATKGIDLSSSGLSGSGDYPIYIDATTYITASGIFNTNVSYRLAGGGAYFENEANTGNLWGINNIVLGSTLTSAILSGNKTKIGTWAGNGVSSAGTANITDVGGAAHGLSLAVGDMVHIQDCTTASHKGFYRIVTAGATTLVLDRVLAATDTDLTVTFYKDVIGFFATDGTNGQRITGYSHQDKPLQIGGDVLAATGHSLGGEDVLIGGMLEVNGAAWFDTNITIIGTDDVGATALDIKNASAASLFTISTYGALSANPYITWSGGGVVIGTSAALLRLNNDHPLQLGTSAEASLLFESADANAKEVILALPNGGAVNVPVFVIGDQGILNADLTWFNGITEPSIALVNAAENAYVRYGSTVDVSANSTGAGSILMKGTTARNSTGFLAITVTGTTYYIPFFTTITG